MRYSILLAAMLIFAGGSAGQSKAAASQDQFPPNFVPSGKEMFKQYCAACHGLNARAQSRSSRAQGSRRRSHHSHQAPRR